MHRALLIPETGPIEWVSVPDRMPHSLHKLQELVGGRVEVFRPIEALPGVTGYLNEDGDGEINRVLTDIATWVDSPRWMNVVFRGPCVLLGFDPAKGETRSFPSPIPAKLAEVLDDAGRLP